MIHVVYLDLTFASRDGLVGYDAALTRLRSGVRLPLLVLLLFAPYVGILRYNISNLHKILYVVLGKYCVTRRTKMYVECECTYHVSFGKKKSFPSSALLKTNPAGSDWMPALTPS